MAKVIDSTNLGYLIGKMKAAFLPQGATETVGVDATPTASSTNLVESGGVYDFLHPVLTTETYKYIPRPQYAEFWFTGTLPTDTSDARTPTSLTFEMKVGGRPVLAADCELSIQGHGSIAYSKKGYTFDVLNKNGDAASLKFGDLPAADSFHLKAYATDMTHTRGLAGAKIWRQMLDVLPYQENLVTNRALSLVATQKKNALYWADAKFSEDGFPCAFYLNGSFHGLYTLKLKKGKPNYALDDSNTDNIFLDAASSNYTAYLSQSFDYTDWELKSPKITGYTPNGQITDAGVLADIQSLWAFTTDLSNKYAQHADYIVLDHWLLWYILCELVCHKDTSGNNYELLTWDGTHWSILPYDMDLTLGLDAWASYTIQTAVTGWQVGTQPGSGDTSFWANFRTLYRGELSTLYTLLRRSVLTIDNLSNIFKAEAECIPRDIYDADYQAWGTIWSNGLPTLQQTLAVLQSRLAFLDGEWLTPDKQPIAGMQPGIKYDLGTLSGAVTFKVASPLVAALGNRYDFAFDSDSTAAVPTWPAGLAWSGNCLDQDGVPEIAASKHYEVSIEDGYGNITEYGPAVTPPTPTPTPIEDLTARINFSQNAYCQTDIIPQSGWRFKLKAQLTNGGPLPKVLVGYRNRSNADDDTFSIEGDATGLNYTALRCKLFGTRYTSANALATSTRYVIEATSAGPSVSPSLGTFSTTTYTFNSAGNLAIGGMAYANNTVGFADGGIDFFGMEIYDGDDQLIHRLLPQSNSTFLDEMTGRSYSCTGTVTYADD